MAAARTARKAVFGLGAVVALMFGIGFLTLAAWIFLDSVVGALNAALILGGFFTGIALIILAVMSSLARARRRAKLHAAATTAAIGAPVAAASSAGLVGIAGLVAAFVTGMTAGAKARS